MEIGKSTTRVDAFDRITGSTKYTAGLEPQGLLAAKIVRSTIANDMVKSFDLEETLKVPGAVRIATCFDVSDIQFLTLGHPWSVETAHQDITGRKLLNIKVWVYGDDIATVTAGNDIAVARAARLMKVEYGEYALLLTVEDTMAENVPRLHDERPGNVIAHSSFVVGEKAYRDAVKEEGPVEIKKDYRTQSVQHCHAETPISFTYMEKGRITVTTSVQIPHIVRRVISQALGLPMGRIRVTRPHIGGSFGNKQDVFYEPLDAFLTTQVGGRGVRMGIFREETLGCTRVCHAIEFKVKAAARKDGMLVAKGLEAYSNQGGYASHTHAIVANSSNKFERIYKDEKVLESDAWTVYTNLVIGGAMRGYGTPQAVFVAECMADGPALTPHMDPLELRKGNCMRPGYVDPHIHIKYNTYGLAGYMEKGREFIRWGKKRGEYENQTRPV